MGSAETQRALRQFAEARTRRVAISGTPRSPCQTARMAERTMSDEHKAAIAAGRVETAAVGDYLEALEETKPKRGRRLSAEQLTERRVGLNTELASGTLKPLKRLEAMQAVRDIDSQLAEVQAQPDMSAVEQGFIEHAASYGERKGIQYATWREAGVPADVLSRAGIGRGR